MGLKRPFCLNKEVATPAEVTDQQSMKSGPVSPCLIIKYVKGTEVSIEIKLAVRPDDEGLTASDWFDLDTFANAGVNPDDAYILRLNADAKLCIPLPVVTGMPLRLSIDANTPGAAPGTVSAWLMNA